MPVPEPGAGRISAGQGPDGVGAAGRIASRTVLDGNREGQQGLDICNPINAEVKQDGRINP